MKYFNISLLSYRNFRISHVLSHHIYPNTLHDLEISFLEDFLKWIPSKKIKSDGLSRYISWIISPILYGFLYFIDFIKHMINCIITKGETFYWDEVLIPAAIPISMYLFGNADVSVVLKIWILIIWTASSAWGWIAINGAHHHPDIQHEGDAHQ